MPGALRCPPQKPVRLYPEHIEAAVEADQNIYIEKPAGADVEGCKRLMLTADSAPRRLNIAFRFPRRFAPLSRKARQLVASSGIGRLTAAHSHWRRGGVHGSEKPESRPTNELERLRQWQNWRDTGGDFIMESYGRAVNVLSWFCGCHPLKAVAPANRTLARRGDLRDQFTVSCIHPKAIQGSRASTHPAAAWNGEVTWAETMA